jgi:hypothetical protein
MVGLNGFGFLVESRSRSEGPFGFGLVEEECQNVKQFVGTSGS